jgi:hypothetical protein
MSSNFREIIKKLYFLVWWKARQRATHATPHLSASHYRTFYTWWTASANRKCEIYSPESLAGGRAGWFAKRCHSLTDHQIDCKLKTKIANTILLLCYFDKICLLLTGGLWQASANLYTGGRLQKGAGASGQPSVDYTTFYRQHLCEEGSRPQQHTWNSKALFYSRWNTAAHSLHFQHLMWTKGY